MRSFFVNATCRTLLNMTLTIHQNSQPQSAFWYLRDWNWLIHEQPVRPFFDAKVVGLRTIWTSLAFEISIRTEAPHRLGCCFPSNSRCDNWANLGVKSNPTQIDVATSIAVVSNEFKWRRRFQVDAIFIVLQTSVPMEVVLGICVSPTFGKSLSASML